MIWYVELRLVPFRSFGYSAVCWQTNADVVEEKGFILLFFKYDIYSKNELVAAATNKPSPTVPKNDHLKKALSQISAMVQVILQS